MRVPDLYLAPHVDVMWRAGELTFLGSDRFETTAVQVTDPGLDFDLLRASILSRSTVNRHFDDTTLHTLEGAGVISADPCPRDLTPLIGFIPFRVGANAWCVRCGRRIFVFGACEEQSLPGWYERIAKTWEQDEHRVIASSLLNGENVELVPAFFPRMVGELIEGIRPGDAEVRIVDIHMTSQGSCTLVDELDSVAIQALNELTKDGDARRMRLIVPTVFPAERITGKLALASAAVFSRHRCITLDSLPPAQVGRGRSPRHAARVAIAESIERLCGQSAPTQAISGVSARQLGRVIPMQRFPIHAAHASTHSGLGKYDPDMPLDWVSTYSLSGQETFAPIDLVYYGAGVRRSNRPPIFFASSSGTAAHTDPHEAREAALIELVERDALMVCWASKMTPVLLSHAVVPTSARAVLANIDSAGYEVILRDITLDLLPVCLALARNRSHASPYVMCGAGCARRMEDAASKALCELETLLWHALGRKDGVPIAATAVKTPIDHAQFYCEPENARHIDFLLTDRPPARPRPSRDEIDKQPLSDFFSNKRFELFYCDITSDEVRETTNLVVYRVLATDLIPITFGFGMEITEGKRFDYVADRPGANRRLTAPSAPHFFS